MSLQMLTREELNRHHEQARVILDNAMRCGDAKTYRLGESLEERCRLEKVRRWREREGPGL